MSAAAAEPAEPIDNPADLELPANVRELADGLPAATQAQLASDLLAALADARAAGDLRPVQAAVHRWRLVRKMVTDPGWQQTVDWVNAGMPGAEVLTYEQARERFGLASSA